MIRDIAFAIWFMLPAASSNGIPVLAAVAPGLRKLDAPMDFGISWRGKRLLGSHKTWRGIVVGTLAGLLCFYLQTRIMAHAPGFGRYVSDGVGLTNLPLYAGALLGFGALLGDAVKSFAKRRVGIASGRSWPPFDQIDFIIGALLIVAPLVVLDWSQYVWILLCWSGVHLLFGYLGYKWGLKSTPI